MLNYEMRWYVGAGTTHGMTPTEIGEALRDVLGAEFGGGTVMHGLGFWTNPHGETFSEPSVVGEAHVEAKNIGDMLALREHGTTVAARLAALLGQQAVRFTFRPIAYLQDVTPATAAQETKAA